MLYIERVVARGPFDMVWYSFHPCMAWGLGVFIVDCVADAHGEVWRKVHHPLGEQPPNVSYQAVNDHRDLGFSGTITLGLNHPEEGGRTREVQVVDVSEQCLLEGDKI